MLNAKVLPLSPRSLAVVRPQVLVEVDAIGALARRIVAVLEADEVSVLNGGATASATIRGRQQGPGRPLSLGHLRDELCNGGSARVVVVSPDCGPLGARRAIVAPAQIPSCSRPNSRLCSSRPSGRSRSASAPYRCCYGARRTGWLSPTVSARFSGSSSRATPTARSPTACSSPRAR